MLACEWLCSSDVNAFLSHLWDSCGLSRAICTGKRTDDKLAGEWSALVIYPFLSKHFRSRAQSWLGSRGESATAAAGVAAILGNMDPHDLIRSAQERFQSVTLDHLPLHYFGNNTPLTASIATPALLGCVDAFVSHSWSDNSGSKEESLEQWARQFRADHGREPTLFIDKYCIDQTDIARSLSCLPIFVAGCNKFLVLFGNTYLQRLWCIVEVFIFLELGRSLDDLVICFIGDSDVAKAELMEAVASFAPNEAKCSFAKDTERLQKVLEAGSQGLEGLKSFVQASFKHPS
eukprot:TRINITY_DN13653_c0_g1_i2.p2 TRINITY_DN13653_c0_g1~~TRINITY_DN13653_c0_g1_i2.p2  ORF type:complete len:290 (+),score=34.47 TRINITY_DN13653_c0_g1_i2:805-1674(+)